MVEILQKTSIFCLPASACFAATVSGCDPTGYYQVVMAFPEGTLSKCSIHAGEPNAAWRGIYEGCSIENSAACLGMRSYHRVNVILRRKIKIGFPCCAKGGKRRACPGGIESCSSSTKNIRRLRWRAICHRLQDCTGHRPPIPGRGLGTGPVRETACGKGAAAEGQPEPAKYRHGVPCACWAGQWSLRLIAASWCREWDEKPAKTCKSPKPLGGSVCESNAPLTPQGANRRF